MLFDIGEVLMMYRNSHHSRLRLQHPRYNPNADSIRHNHRCIDPDLRISERLDRPPPRQEYSLLLHSVIPNTEYCGRIRVAVCAPAAPRWEVDVVSASRSDDNDNSPLIPL
jgi:hypothetical protein